MSVNQSDKGILRTALSNVWFLCQQEAGGVEIFHWLHKERGDCAVQLRSATGRLRGQEGLCAGGTHTHTHDLK